MRIAFLNRDRHSHPGGDIVQIDATIAALARIGVEAVYLPHDCTPADIAKFDLCHLFHCNFKWAWENSEKVCMADKPYVVTPIFYPDFWEIEKQQCRTILWESLAILPFSEAEACEIRKGLNSFDMAMTPIPNGTNEAFHAPNATMDREGVLCVAARQGDKNTDIVERICRDLGIRFTLACGVPHSEMPAIYKRHRVFVNASGSERMSLTIGEALCAGCRVLATGYNRGNEWYPGISIIDPSDSILGDRIASAYEWSQDGWDFTPNEAARKLTWDSVAMRLVKVYQEALR